MVYPFAAQDFLINKADPNPSEIIVAIVISRNSHDAERIPIKFD